MLKFTKSNLIKAEQGMWFVLSDIKCALNTIDLDDKADKRKVNIAKLSKKAQALANDLKQINQELAQNTTIK